MKKIIIFSTFLFCMSIPKSFAQILPDSTLPNNSQIINKNNQILIEQGTVKGDNLFHSFDSFSIPANLKVIFNNSSVNNIFTRVTGNSISIIDGILSVNGNANLFFLNPNGIIFGKDAALDLTGSFIATSANSISFEDGYIFSAKDLHNSPNLTVSLPIGLNINSNAGSIKIINEGHKLNRINLNIPSSSINPFDNSLTKKGLNINDNTLALIGGEIILDGGIININKINNLELISINDGSVTLTLSDKIINLSSNQNSTFKDIYLKNKSIVSIFGNDRGLINIEANNLNILQSSMIAFQNQGSIVDNNSQIKININNLKVSNIMSQSADIFSGIITETVSLGKAPNINILANNIYIEGFAGISSGGYLGQGGDINIVASNLKLFQPLDLQPMTNGIASIAVSNNLGGNINIQAEYIELDNYALIGTSNFGFQKGGDINIISNKILIQNNSLIGSSTFGEGIGGNINVVTQDIQLSKLNNRRFPSPYFSFTSFEILPRQSNFIGTSVFGSGKGGSFSLSGGSLSIEDGSVIGSDSFGTGDSGDIELNLKNIQVIGQNFFSFPSSISSSSYNLGNAGKININSDNILIKDGGRINTTAFANGNAGDLIINAKESLILTSNTNALSSINSSTVILPESFRLVFNLPSQPTGISGNLIINSSNISILKGGLVEASNESIGNGGILTINSERLNLDRSQISSTTISGDGGNININADAIISKDGRIITNSQQIGDGGIINIDTDTLLSLSSIISANAIQGDGGRISIVTNGLFTSPDSQITATSTFGQQGTVDIQILEEFDEKQIEILNYEIKPEQNIFLSKCLESRQSGRFTVSGNGGIPNNPQNSIDSFVAPEDSTTVSSDFTVGEELVRTPDGRLLLTAKTTPEPVENLVCR